MDVIKVNITDQTIREGADLIEEILDVNLANGAFASTSRSQAFRVDFDESINTPASRRSGRMAFHVYTQPVDVAELVEALVTNLS